LVEVPGGEFEMGSNDGDADEKPVHRVWVNGFLMGKTEVTQAQWRVVSKLPKVRIDLPSEPSNFKGDTSPVEQVSWDEAVEFCARLSRKTGGKYGLPSEAEWEYAARARTTTPFAFGATIMPELANYDGSTHYGQAAKGEYRQKTTPVGSFPANAWGWLTCTGTSGSGVRMTGMPVMKMRRAMDVHGRIYPIAACPGSFGAAVGAATPTVAGRRIAAGARPASVTATSVSVS
jgi:formylglycine-generating enzyme required for sulfatase activity